MKIVLAAFLLVCLSTSAVAGDSDIANTWINLDKKYADLVDSSKFIDAIQVAEDMNEIDPASTQALLYIVFAYVKAGRSVPSWVMNEPWPNAKPIDRVRRKLADSLMGHSKK